MNNFNYVDATNYKFDIVGHQTNYVKFAVDKHITKLNVRDFELAFNQLDKTFQLISKNYKIFYNNSTISLYYYHSTKTVKIYKDLESLSITENKETKFRKFKIVILNNIIRLYDLKINPFLEIAYDHIKLKNWTITWDTDNPENKKFKYSLIYQVDITRENDKNLINLHSGINFFFDNNVDLMVYSFVHNNHNYLFRIINLPFFSSGKEIKFTICNTEKLTKIDGTLQNTKIGYEYKDGDKKYVYYEYFLTITAIDNNDKIKVETFKNFKIPKDFCKTTINLYTEICKLKDENCCDLISDFGNPITIFYPDLIISEFTHLYGFYFQCI